MSIAEHMNRAMEKAKSKHHEKKKHEGKHKIERMEIEPEDGGEGFVMTHHYPMNNDAGMTRGGAVFRGGSGSSGYKEPTKHVAKNHKEMIKHVKEHMCPDAADVEESAEMK